MRKAFAGSLLVVSIALWGCPAMDGNGDVNGNDNAGGEQRSFTATLDGGQETPPVETEGSGSGTFTLNAEQTELSFTVTASGLSGPVTLAHFHRGAAGVAGPVAVDIFGSLEEADGNITLEGVWEVTEDDVADLLNGDIYINLHTAEHPAGEIRGQLEAEE